MANSRRSADFLLGKVMIDGGEVTVTGDLELTEPLPAGTNNIGDVDVASVAAPTTVVYGRKTIAAAGTEEVLASSTALTQGVTVRGLTANTGLVFVGGASGVSSANGYQLAAGESVFIACANLDDVWIDVATNGEGVSYIGS